MVCTFRASGSSVDVTVRGVVCCFVSSLGSLLEGHPQNHFGNSLNVWFLPQLAVDRKPGVVTR